MFRVEAHGLRDPVHPSRFDPVPFLSGVALEPFRLACPHCSSKVIVRHEHLLGQTLPCPKCRGAIAVPATRVAATKEKESVVSNTPSPRVNVPVVNSATITKVGELDWEEVLSRENLAQYAQQTSEQEGRFRAAPDVASASQVDEDPVFSPMEENDKPARPTNWQSSKIAKQRQWLTLASVGIVASLAAIGLFIVFMQVVGGPSKTKPEVAQVDANKANHTQPVQNSSEVTPEIEHNEPKHASDSNQPGTETVDPTPPEANPSSTENVADHHSEPSTKPHEAVEVPAETPTESEPGLPSVFNRGLGPNADLRPADSSKTNAVGEAEPKEPDEKLPEVFGVFQSFLGKNNSFADSGFGDRERANELDPEYADVTLAQSIHPPAKPIPDWAEKSKFPIANFNSKNLPLLRCIDLFSRMTGVGITLDWQSLRLAGIDLRAPTEIEGKAESIQALVEKLIQSHGLEWQLDKQGLPVLSATRAAMEANLPTDWSVAEAFPQGSEAQACQLLIQLWGMDSICSYQDGRLQWAEAATPIEKANMMASIIQLADIRKLANGPWKSSNHPLLFSPSDWNRCNTALEKPISESLIVPEPRPISELLITAATHVDLDLCVDWQHVWGHGLVPSQTATSVLRSRTLPQVANRFMTDYSLEMIPIGERCVWITTSETRRQLSRVIPVRLPKNFQLDDLKQSLKMIAPVGPDGRSRFRVVAIPGDEDLFYVRVCTPMVEQLTDPDLVLGFSWPNAR